MAPSSSAAQPLPCKLCGAPSRLFGVIDFHKSCLEQRGQRLPLSGHPIYYRRCTQCDFLFTTVFDAWTMQDFQQYIYNDEYLLVDPDYKSVRPLGSAALVASTFQSARSSMQVLDFGGGAGLLAETLRNQGFSATTYDPFSAFNELPQTQFNLITCFEVLEHLPSPRETVATMVALLSHPGLILFSTLLQPPSIQAIGLTWWYAAPRNGHVSLYSAASLARLFEPHGLKVVSLSDNLHLAYAHLAPFAAHLAL